jgi:serine/threonine protein phosphatase PrpC
VKHTNTEIGERPLHDADSGLIRIVDADTLKEGLIIDGKTDEALSCAEILTMTTNHGDEIVATTHHGHGYRTCNEDRIALVDRWFGEESRTYISVIDGMGGHQRGDISASIIAQELIKIAVAEAEELEDELCSALVQDVSDAIDRLPTERLANDVRRSVSLDAEGRKGSFEGVVRSTIEAVQLESVRMAEATSENLQKIAEVLRTLSGLRQPVPFEVAIQRARERIGELGFKNQAPDACVISAAITAGPDGGRMLDLRQIGDCKLFVARADGTVCFETIGESLIPEPDLEREDLQLAELMTYSLHRNLVTNSVTSRRVSPKRYRRSEVPVHLWGGDLICVYSDGVDDLFSPREILDLVNGKGLVSMVREMLEISEHRMKFVANFLAREREKLTPARKMKAYPAVHQFLNEGRILNGAYVEFDAEGNERRWTKPPKCDNTAFCAIRIAGAANRV